MAEVIPLGRRLREHREQLGMSQAQAARELDVARTAYRLWELEAARPSNDRWRAISRWLGISVAALLLTEELGISGSEELEHIARGLQDPDWDALPAATATWQPAEFRKELVAGPTAVEEARAALAVTASGIPTDAMETVDRLLVALFEDSVADSEGPSAIVGLHIAVGRRTLRVAASDRSGNGGGGGEGPGWGFVMDHATRWGATGRRDIRARWFEIDLPEPGVNVAE